MRVSDRVHELAAQMDPKGNKSRAVEFAVELVLALRMAEENTESLRFPDGTILKSDGPLSDDARNRMLAHDAITIQRVLESCVRAAVEAVTEPEEADE